MQHLRGRATRAGVREKIPCKEGKSKEEFSGHREVFSLKSLSATYRVERGQGEVNGWSADQLFARLMALQKVVGVRCPKTEV